MTLDTPCVPVLLTVALTLAGFVQAAAGWLAVRRFSRTVPLPGAHPAITVLKPLHGDEPLLEQALASFCAQSYPHFQIVFGVQDAKDTAVAVAGGLRGRSPLGQRALGGPPTTHGSNRKIANLINMFPSARHNFLVISDSDMHAPPNYLSSVADALSTPGTGRVTTLYTGLPARLGLSGLLGASYITQSFAAGALMARALGRQDCMGATMALTRETLMRVGGLPALSPYVADDAVLGAKVRALGKNVVLAKCVPATTVGEVSLASLFAHELRWARTIRAVEPLGFAVSVIQFPAFWALLSFAMSGGAAWAAVLWAVAVGVRGGFGLAVERAMGAVRTPFWMPALRDVLSMAVLLTSYMGQDVAWRGHVLSTGEDTHYSAERVLLATRRG